MSNGGWRVSVPVPTDLLKTFNKTRVKRSLETHSAAEANKLKHGVIAEFFKMFDDARAGRVSRAAVQGASATGNRTKENTALALELRSVLQAAEGTDQFDIEREGVDLVAEQIRGPEIGHDEETDTPIYDDAREKEAGAFLKVALGMATPLRDPVETFYSQKDWKPRTKADHRRAMEMLEAWCRENRIPFTVEAINRKKAGQFIGAMASDATRPLSNQSINKYISALSTYWDWMEKRGLAEDGSSPWSRQSLPKQKPKEGEEERPFTDEELAKLLTGEPDEPYIKPLMLIGALTGARIDVIASLRVKDITDDGFLRFKKQKKESRSRLVPIHPDLVEVLAKLREGKEPDDGLFPECPPLPADKEAEQSMPAVKAFGKYRIAMGVHERIEGKRRSRVNFHSFRRWFITKALQADQPLLTVQLVVGHQPQSMAEKKYLGGLTPEQLRTCVEAVKLPSLASPDLREENQGQPVVAHDHA